MPKGDEILTGLDNPLAGFMSVSETRAQRDEQPDLSLESQPSTKSRWKNSSTLEDLSENNPPNSMKFKFTKARRRWPEPAFLSHQLFRAPGDPRVPRLARLLAIGRCPVRTYPPPGGQLGSID